MKNYTITGGAGIAQCFPSTDNSLAQEAIAHIRQFSAGAEISHVATADEPDADGSFGVYVDQINSRGEAYECELLSSHSTLEAAEAAAAAENNRRDELVRAAFETVALPDDVLEVDVYSARASYPQNRCADIQVRLTDGLRVEVGCFWKIDHDDGFAETRNRIAAIAAALRDDLAQAIAEARAERAEEEAEGAALQ